MSVKKELHLAVEMRIQELAAYGAHACVNCRNARVVGFYRGIPGVPEVRCIAGNWANDGLPLRQARSSAIKDTRQGPSCPDWES